MKFRSVAAYLILSVYTLTLVHTVIPHDHHAHDWLQDNILAAYCQADDHDHHDGDVPGEHEHDHSNHSLPHHNQSQHPDNYTFNNDTTNNSQSQLTFLSAGYCNRLQTIDLAPGVREIKLQHSDFVPLKIPIQFSSSVPLRAPPIV